MCVNGEVCVERGTLQSCSTANVSQSRSGMNLKKKKVSFEA